MRSLNFTEKIKIALILKGYTVLNKEQTLSRVALYATNFEKARMIQIDTKGNVSIFKIDDERDGCFDLVMKTKAGSFFSAIS
jgi:hypothetical protein